MKAKRTGTRMMTNWKKFPIDPAEVPFNNLFMCQLEIQEKMLSAGLYDVFKSEDTKVLPADDTRLMSYHIQQLMSEIGEVLESDKRWKNFRNQKYDRRAKLEEIADCFIVMMNVAMFSGFDGSEVAQAVVEKMMKVQDRIFEK